MDPIGLGFEDFDGAGVYRALENGQAIDDSGEVKASDVTGTFHGAGELAAKLASSAQVRSCVVTKWFRTATAAARPTPTRAAWRGSTTPVRRGRVTRSAT